MVVWQKAPEATSNRKNIKPIALAIVSYASPKASGRQAGSYSEKCQFCGRYMMASVQNGSPKLS